MNASPFLLAGALFALGALFIALAHRRRPAPPGTARADWRKYGTYLALIAALLCAAEAGRWLLAFAVAALAIGWAAEAGRAPDKTQFMNQLEDKAITKLLLKIRPLIAKGDRELAIRPDLKKKP